MEVLYYPGCTLKTSGKNLEASAFEVMKALGHTMVEMEEWNCCGVVSSLTSDDLMKHIAPLRNLIHAEDQGKDRIVVVCDMCANTLKQTDQRVRGSEEDLQKLNDFMDRENDYQQSVTVQHLMEFIRDEVGYKMLRKKVKNPLKGIKIMPYYGCMLLRPRDVAIDDAEEPTIMNDMINAMGGTAVDNPFKVECCGAYRTIDQKEMTAKRAHNISKVATERKADMIMVSCPLCRYNLDVRGKEAEGLYDGHSQVPVVYYTQVLALALGADPDTLGLDEHAVDPRPLLREKGVIP